ncbi:MAG TPA: hypothetical protein IGQ44_07985, partial [Geminocystis sp. M7585_C2015_104]|nr:hypothetical protein [Geminocystis sp. M7585_C2015_104]
MKDYTGITVHTPVEKIIQNLDLEEEGELSHCQQSLMAEKKEMAVKRDDEIATVKLQQGDLAEKQEEKDSNKVTSSYPSMGENEPQSIPIARRILPEESFEPPHFSPWTVFGILLSLLASIFLWLGISGDTSTPGNGRDNNTNSFQNAQQEKQASVESRPAPTIGTSLHVPTPPSHPGKIPSLPPYPDLKTAILTEIRKNQALTGPHT